MALATTENDVNVKNIEDKIWMLRPCYIYYEEYKECASIKGRFHQKYVSGDTKECWQWKQDYTNCELYQKNKDLHVLAPVIQHEEERRAERLKGANGNDVWEYRLEPPSAWNSPLPSHLTKTFNKENDSRTICCIS